MSEKAWPFPQPVPVLGTDSNDTCRNFDVEIFDLTDIRSTPGCGWKQLRRLIILVHYSHLKADLKDCINC